MLGKQKSKKSEGKISGENLRRDVGRMKMRVIIKVRERESGKKRDMILKKNGEMMCRQVTA